MPRDVLAHGYVDYVIVGEGEYALLELVQSLESGGKNISEIKGLFHLGKDGSVVFNGPHEPIPDLDALPYPARHLVNMRHYRLEAAIHGVKNMMALSTSRGCPFRCSFCTSSNYWQRKYRARSPEKILDEVEFLIEEYGCDGIVFREDNFTVNKKHVLDICKEFHRRRISLSWQCESRVDTVDREMLDIMRASGCDLIWFGIESGNQKTLDFLDKGITIEQIERVFGWCKELGMKTGATFMIGIPGETKTETMNTYHFAKHLNPNWASFQAYLGLPVSKLYDYVVTHDLYKECIQGIYIVETKEIEV
jgi:radical SAM superfamily enzyme YgiQ (UPF0313 family)